VRQGIGAGGWAVRTLPADVPFPAVQPLPGGEWVVVGSRAREPEHNATIFGNGSAPVRSFHAGDAIQDVQATADGRVWVSNFDEMLSNDSELAEGLICLDVAGRPVFRYRTVAARHELPGIIDCYALNVVDEHETWLCYYTEFPLVQLIDDEPARVWRDTGIRGSKAIAISERFVLFSPGYSTRATVTRLERLTGYHRQFTVVTETGQRLGRAVDWVARGPMMYCQARGALYAIDARDLD
jgi:hypothetical protein